MEKTCQESSSDLPGAKALPSGCCWPSVSRNKKTEDAFGQMCGVFHRGRERMRASSACFSFRQSVFYRSLCRSLPVLRKGGICQQVSLTSVMETGLSDQVISMLSCLPHVCITPSVGSKLMFVFLACSVLYNLRVCVSRSMPQLSKVMLAAVSGLSTVILVRALLKELLCRRCATQSKVD